METKVIRTNMVFVSPEKVKEAYKAKLITLKESWYYLRKFGV